MMHPTLEYLESQSTTRALQIYTLGEFRIVLHGKPVPAKAFGREKAVQLLQFLVTNRHRKALHKEQIIDRLWEEDADTGLQTFKVALHGLTKALEPDKKSHAEAQYILRQGATYRLHHEAIWIDTDALENYIAFGNQHYKTDTTLAIRAYTAAVALLKGTYLPDRIYDDWSCDERERLQVISMGALMTLGELLLPENPMESIRLAQQTLLIDAAWEDAYRLQMAAYFQKGNRPMAIKTYQQCVKTLHEEMGINPLPETQQLYKTIIEA